MPACENFAHWRPKPFILEIDGQRHPATFAALGKTPRYGGDLAITPRARLDRPEFEICLIDSVHGCATSSCCPSPCWAGFRKR